MTEVGDIRRFLRSRGWRQYLSAWWYRPLPGRERRRAPATNQETFTLDEAFRRERAKVNAEEE